MDPLDEFEAFARLIETGGHDLDSVAALFGVERRRVSERLRYGRIHPDIREAAREKKITLDVMKAFASHPDHGTQWAVYEATEGSYRQAWTIRDKLEKAGVKIGSDIGQYVEMEYRAADGLIAADLIVEDSVLTDEALVERLLVAKLSQHAEAERERLGFAWSEGRRTADYEALRAFGRTYPTTIEPEGEAARRATEIADRLLAIDELREAEETAGDGTDFEALEDGVHRPPRGARGADDGLERRAAHAGRGDRPLGLRRRRDHVRPDPARGRRCGRGTGDARCDRHDRCDRHVRWGRRGGTASDEASEANEGTAPGRGCLARRRPADRARDRHRRGPRGPSGARAGPACCSRSWPTS